MINLVLNRAVYGTEWRPAPPVITARARPVNAPGALAWPNKTRDRSPTRLLVNVPMDETVFGKASPVTEATTLYSTRAQRRDSKKFAEWKRKMGLL